MRSKSLKTKKQYQEKFFDEHPVFYPWPHLLMETGFNKIYKLREAKIRKYLDFLKMKPREKVLDIGCGTGIFLVRVAKTYGVDGTGIDISEKSIATAKSLRLRSGQATRLHFQVGDAVQLPFANKSFDYVLSFDSLEHIQDQAISLSEMVRVLKPKGSLLVYTINRNQRYTWHFWLSKLGVPIGKRAAHDPELFLDPNWVRKELTRLGVEIKSLELFHSFFTLAVDEVIMLFLLGFKCLNLFDPSSRFKTLLGRTFLNSANFFSRLFLLPLEALEVPWKKAGYSNSFFILGEKR